VEQSTLNGEILIMSRLQVQRGNDFHADQGRVEDIGKVGPGQALAPVCVRCKPIGLGVFIL